MAGRIPQTFINDLLDRIDIVDVVERRVTLKKSGKNYSGLCPFHDEKTPSFTVSPDKQFFHCFGCQESGTALSFVMKYDRLEFVEAVETLAQQLGLEVPREQGGPARPRVDPDLYTVLARAEKHYRDALRHAPEAIEYLKGRGLTGEIARDYGIGYAPDEWQGLTTAIKDVSEKLWLDTGMLTKNEKGRVYDRFRGRIMFPIRDTRGRVIAFGGRVLTGDNGPKYLNSPETEIFHKGQELYGLYEVRRALRHIDRLLVVEGYMDVVALAQFGVMNAVATLGTASGTQHFHKLFRYTDEVVCCFDGDNAGRQAAWKALENALPVLNELRQLKFVFLPDGEDPDSLVRDRGREVFQQMLDNALPAMEFLLQKMSAGLDLNTVDGRARFAGLMGPYLDKLAAGTLQDLVRQRVDEMTGQTRAAPQDRPRRAQPARSSGRVTALSERLLTILMRQPRLWHALDPAVTGPLLEALDAESLPGAVINYVACNPEVEADELLVWFDDAEFAPALRELARKPLAIDANALPAELRDVCGAVLKRLQDDARREVLQAVKESQNFEQLRTYTRLRRSEDDYSS